MTETIKTREELKHAAQEAVGRFAKDHPKDRALVVGLLGELGAGKTAFTKCVAKVLGIEEEITSPTFVIEKIYALPTTHPFSHFVHIDAYRLSGAEELRALGFERLAADPGNLIFVEWADNVKEIMPPRAPIAEFSVINDTTRTLSWR